MHFALAKTIPSSQKTKTKSWGRNRLYFPHGEMLTCYYSNEHNAICAGEFLLQKYPTTDSIGKQVFLINTVKDDLWLGIVIEKWVTIETTGSLEKLLEQLDYDIQTADHFYHNSSELIKVDFESVTIIEDAAVLFDSVNDSYIIKRNIKKPILIVAVLCVLGASFLGYKIYTHEPPKELLAQQVPVNPWKAWREMVKTQNIATTALDNAARLYSYSVLLPEEWPVKQLTKSGNALLLEVSKKDKALLAEWDAFVNLNPSIQPYIDDNNHTISAPLKTDTNTQIIPIIGGWKKPLHDTLVNLGGQHITVVEQSFLNYQQIRFNVTFTNVSFAMLSILSDIFNKVPAYLTGLSVKPSGNNKQSVTIDLNVTLQGVISHE